MINFSTLKGLSIPEGNVVEIKDPGGRVLWSAIKPATITIEGSGSTYAYVEIDGVQYNGAATVEVNIGSVIRCVTQNSTYGGQINLNYESVASGSGAQYDYTVVSDATIKLETKDPSGYGYAIIGAISIADKNAPAVATITITKTGSGQPNAGPAVVVNGTRYTTAGTISVPVGTVVKCEAPWGKGYNSSTYTGGTITLNGEVVAERGSTSPTVYQFVSTDDDIDIALALSTIMVSQSSPGFVGNITITGSVIDANKVLTDIAITTPPNKTTYKKNENFDATGMVVTAAYDDGSSAVITNYSVIGGTSLKAGTESVTIAYAENGIRKTAEQPIEVIADFAVLYTDGSLVFYKRAGLATAGGTFDGKTVVKSYNDVENTGTAYKWEDERAQIVTVSFADPITPTSCYRWFNNCGSLTSITWENLDTSNVTNMERMFDGCGLNSLDLSSFDTSKVTNMRYMFSDCEGLRSLDLSSFDTSKVTDMEGMFYTSDYVESVDLSNFDTSNVTNMRYMFYHCYGLRSLDLSSFDTSKVTNMDRMFYACEKLHTIYASELFNTDAVTESTWMFGFCDALVGGQGSTGLTPDKTSARIDGGESAPGYFTEK